MTNRPGEGRSQVAGGKQRRTTGTGSPFKLSRREFMRLSAAAGVTLSPLFSGLKTALSLGLESIPEPMKRRFGRIEFDVTTLGLGGQASIQRTPADVDPVAIIEKAFNLGINYFDTSNNYGPSQLNFGRAFRRLNLVPGLSGYDRQLRESVFLTTKTMIRWARGSYPLLPGVRNSSEGLHGGGAVADLKRSLSQMFGHDDGTYPQGSYVDMVMVHNLTSFEEIDILYRGLESPLDRDGNFGALVALRDYRDGTNVTGLNPKEEKLIRHLGFSGHYSAPVMIEMIQRDRWNLLDGMLVALNINDRRYLNMQYNVLPVARAKNMAVIGMKVFADGAMYFKEPRWSVGPGDVMRIIGTNDLPSRPLIEYPLTAPGIHSVIIGIGEINNNPLKCQLVQNYYAAQIEPGALNERERRGLEKLGERTKGGETNYFQLPNQGLSPPGNLALERRDMIRLTWDTAYAGDEPLSHYEIIRDGQVMATIRQVPQISKDPFMFEAPLQGGIFSVTAVDVSGRRAESRRLSA